MQFIKDQKTAAALDALTSGAVEEITKICAEIGPRPCGEDGEREAQTYLLDKISPYADCAVRETYEVHPKAFMGFVPVAGTLLLGATAANLVSAFYK